MVEEGFLEKLEEMYSDPKRKPTERKLPSPPKLQVLAERKGSQTRSRAMSKLEREIKQEAFGKPPRRNIEPRERVPKDNKWQDYLSVCLKKIDQNDPESMSHIELLTGHAPMNPNAQMRACGVEWKKDRLLTDPMVSEGGFYERFKTEVKKFKGGLKNIESY